MAQEVTTPIITDTTGQDIVDALEALAGASLIGVSTGTSALIDGTSDLASGTLYLQYEE